MVESANVARGRSCERPARSAARRCRSRTAGRRRSSGSRCPRRGWRRASLPRRRPPGRARRSRAHPKPRRVTCTSVRPRGIDSKGSTAIASASSRRPVDAASDLIVTFNPSVSSQYAERESGGPADRMRLATYRAGRSDPLLGVVASRSPDGGRRPPAGCPADDRGAPRGQGPSPCRRFAPRPTPIVSRRDGTPLDEVELLAPVPRPGKVVAIGRNYADHTLEESGDPPPPEPLIFAKWPSSVVGPGAEIVWDPSLTSQVDYEAELGVVIGRRTRSISIGGCPRVGARLHLLERRLGARPPVRRRPMGPGQVARHVLPNRTGAGHAGRARRSVGPGDLVHRQRRAVQSARTSDMFFDVAAIISHCSRSFTLEPGDSIATGTPGGVGVFRDPPRFLADGDRGRGRSSGSASSSTPAGHGPRRRRPDRVGDRDGADRSERALPRHRRPRLHRRVDGPGARPRRRPGCRLRPCDRSPAARAHRHRRTSSGE